METMTPHLPKRLLIWGRKLRVLTYKEFLQLFRDIILLVFIVYAFTVDIYLAGSGVSLQVKRASTVVHDADHSNSSRELIHRFRLPYFRLDGEVPSESSVPKSWSSHT